MNISVLLIFWYNDLPSQTPIFLYWPVIYGCVWWIPPNWSPPTSTWWQHSISRSSAWLPSVPFLADMILLSSIPPPTIGLGASLSWGLNQFISNQLHTMTVINMSVMAMLLDLNFFVLIIIFSKTKSLFCRRASVISPRRKTWMHKIRFTSISLLICSCQLYNCLKLLVSDLVPDYDHRCRNINVEGHGTNTQLTHRNPNQDTFDRKLFWTRLLPPTFKRVNFNKKI